MGDIFGGGGGGGSTQTSTTNTIAQPPAFQIPYIERVMNEALAQFEGPSPQQYPGQTVAGINQLQQQGQAGALDYAAGAGTGTVNNLLDAQNFQLTDAANPLTNPYFASTARAMIHPATQALTESVLPQIQQGALLAGNYGSDRQGIAEGRAIDAYQQNILNTLSQFGTSAYNQGLDTQSRAIALAPSTLQAGLFPSSIYQGIGNDLQQAEQNAINADISRFNYEQNLPYNKLAQFSGFVGNPLGQDTSVTSPVSQTNPYVAAGGGALTGYAGAQALGFGSAAPYAAAVGALLGYYGS